MVLIHAGAVLAPWTFTWTGFWIFFWLQLLTGLGVTLCYHRLLAHRSFHVPRWLEYALTVIGSLSVQGGPVKWVATHRVHHAFSDRPQDPHSPNKGFWWAHMLWLFPYDEVLDNPSKYERYVPDLARNRVHQFIERTHVLYTVLLGLILLALGGWPWVIWGVFLRTAVVWHSTWLVNSASHLWGYKTFDTNEGSTNNWWVALLSYGEGWHNNHHAYLHSAAHGLRWWEFDMTYATIRLLSWLGLAKRIRLPQGNPAKLPAMDPVEALRKIRLPVPSLSI
ncbi:MAG: fatty acid desaturase [Candidatus Omnitrophica bacterium]|nr:fatty acid desaturase [Candidatus Omnitrophota bacterium]